MQSTKVMKNYRIRADADRDCTAFGWYHDLDRQCVFDSNEIINTEKVTLHPDILPPGKSGDIGCFMRGNDQSTFSNELDGFYGMRTYDEFKVLRDCNSFLYFRLWFFVYRKIS